MGVVCNGCGSGGEEWSRLMVIANSTSIGKEDGVHVVCTCIGDGVHVVMCVHL